RAVGWLGKDANFVPGPTNARDFEKLCSLLVEPWQPMGLLGWHDCELCQFSKGPRTQRFGSLEVRMGITNVFVPAGPFVFVAPSLIAHYIDCHRYAPPPPFLEAVRNCPEMGSMAYKKAVLAAGGRELARGMSGA
ncbi:MAG: hypothetical protein K1X64_18635, partial [Myxococcaceae bacterium]|nr:hypothetical protein [Myxococcaceae bacterium]